MNRLLTPCAVVVFALCSLAAPQFTAAAKVAVWRQDSKEDFDSGKLSGVVVGPEGELTLGRELQELADLGAASVWDLVRTAEGKVVAATALPGQVVEIEPSGKVRTLWKDDQVQAFSLVALGDDTLLVGTGPQGVIYKLTADGQKTEFFNTNALYVWDLVRDSSGNLYAATGPKGQVFKIDSSGEGKVFYETKQQHVLALALAEDRTLICGTDGAGLVLAVDAAGKGRVLYDAAEGEVRSLWAAPEGIVYAGTAAAAERSSGGPSRPTGGSPSTPAKPGTNTVYRLAPDGGVRKVWSAAALTYALAPLSAAGSAQVVAGTGPEGVLFALDEDGRGQRQLARLDTEMILSLLPRKDQPLLLGTGNPGKLFSLAGEHQTSGTLTSKPLDAKLPAHFGAITWRADVPNGTQVSIAVRSGNTEDPDETWSAWSVEQTDADAARAECPAARFLQYRLTLTSRNRRVTPQVRSVAIRYATANQSPQITKLTVPHVDEKDGKSPAEKFKLEWEAADANDDELVYALCFRKPEWKTWVKLKDNLTATSYEWDATSVPEGTYQVRLTADDARSNPKPDALSATLTSEPFVVDRSAPRVESRLIGLTGDTATFEMQAIDACTPIVSAGYSLDSNDWANIFPEDRLFDAPREKFRFVVSPVAPGTHVIVVRATDAAGHTGSADVVFEVK